MAYTAGSAWLQVVPSFEGVQGAFERELNKIGVQVDAALAKSVASGMAKGAADAKVQGAKAGEEYAGAFTDAVRKRLDLASKALGLKVKPEIEQTDFDRQLIEMRAKLAELRDQHVNAEIDDKTFHAALKNMAADMKRLEQDAPDLSHLFNLQTARGEVEKLAETLDNTAAKALQAGDRSGGAFAEAFKTRVRAALAALPDITLHADSSDADVKLAAVKRELKELSSQHIGVDIDEATAEAKLLDLHRRLVELSRNDVSVRVRVEAAAGAAELAALLGLEKEVENNSPNVNAKGDNGSLMKSLEDLSSSSLIVSSRLLALVAVGASIGTVLVPAAAAAAVAIGAIGTAAGAAASGIGVAILGFSGIGGAVQALGQYQNAAQKSAASLSGAQNRVEKSVDGVASAERSLANTRATVASAAQRSAQQVVDAQQGVVDAERAVVDAQRQAKQAQDDLTKAYEDARRAQEQMTFDLRGNALAQRQATLDIVKAKQDLDKLLANPRATDAEREQARVTYEEKILQLDELSSKAKQLAEDKAEQDKKGVAGSDQVVAAQDRIRQANERVATAQEGVTKATQRVADAIQSQKDQARQGQFQIEQGQAAIVNAMRAAEQASVKAGVAGGSALDTLNTAMKQLGPTGQEFARFLFSLKPIFLDIRNTAQAGLLPGVEAGLKRLLPYVSGFEAFVHKVAVALADIFQGVITELEKPTWQKFFSFIDDTAVPTLQGMAVFAENVARGLAALFLSLTPFNHQIGGGLIQMSEAFAHWAETLSTNSGFQKFLDYVARTGPKVVDLIKQLAEFIVRFVIAAAPIGEVVLKVLAKVFDVINSWPIGVMVTIVSGLAIFATTLLAVTGAVKGILLVRDAYKAVMTAWEFVTTRMSKASAALTGAVTDAGKAGQVFGFGLQQVNQTTQQAEQSTSKLAGTFRLLRDSMLAIGEREQAGINRIGSGISTAGGAVGTAASKAGGAVSNVASRVGSGVSSGVQAIGNIISPALESGLARYTALVTTAQGQVGLLARAQEVAAPSVAKLATAIGTAADKVAAFGKTVVDSVSTEQARYMTALTIQEGAARAYGAVHDTIAGGVSRAWKAVTDTVGSEQARYMTALTVQEGALRAYGAAHDAVAGKVTGAFKAIGDTVGTEQARYMTALTIQEAAARTWGTVHETVASRVSAAMSGMQSVVSAGASAIGNVTERAMTRVKTAASSIGDSLAAGAKKASNGLGGLMAMMGGPWGVVLTGAAVGVGLISSALAESKSRVDALKDSLNQLLDAYRQSNTLSTPTIANLLKQNDGLADLVLNSDKYGVSLQTMQAAQAGMPGTYKRIAAAQEEVRTKQGGLTQKQAEGFQALLDLATQGEKNVKINKALGISTDDVRAAWGRLTPAQEALNKMLVTLADSTSTATDKASALRAADDAIFGGLRANIKAQDDAAASQDTLTKTLDEYTKAHGRNTKAYDSNTDAGRNNRTALEDRFTALNNEYFAEVQAGGSIDDATAKHDKNRDAIIKAAKAAGNDKDQVDQLATAFGTLPTDPKVVVSVSGVADVMAALQNAEIAQYGLDNNLSPADATKKWLDSHQQAATIFHTKTGQKFFATGGPVNGPGGPTDDLIPAMLSAGEYVIPARIVQALGVQYFDRMIGKRKLPDYPGDGSGGIKFATGGEVWPVRVDISKTKIPSVSQWEGQVSGTLAAAQQFVRAQVGKHYGWNMAGPWSYDCSGLISAAYNVAHGSPVYRHTFSTMNEAPYFPKPGYGPFTAAWTNPGERGVGGDSVGHTAGQIGDLRFESVGSQGVRIGPQVTALNRFAHIGHYADGGLVPWQPQLFDNGGWIQPGWNPPIYNATGAPEPVLSQQQWGDLSRLAANGQSGPGTVHNWQFLDTTLDPAKLQAIQDREAAKARVGRSR